MNNVKLNSYFKNILLVGDVHGYFDDLNKIISSENPDLILQVGDFGYWPRFEGYDLLNVKKPWYMQINNGPIPIYWCDGNHEDHWELKKIHSAPEVLPNIFYMPRGSVLTLKDGTNIMFMGGAESIDKQHRTMGHDWYPEESISQRDIMDLPDVDVDIMISHSAPMDFNISYAKEREASRLALSVLLHQYKPKLWYFGHFHDNISGYVEDTNTEWHCINMVPEKYCYRWLQYDK